MISNKSKIRKALVPAAGFGTRFLPASKVIPKVMFPVIDKPIIQIVVEELVKSGITDITFVLKPHVEAVRQHFQPFEALNLILKNSGKEAEIEKLKKIEQMADFHFVQQREGRHGTGIAILSAKDLIGSEPFVLCWSDEFFKADPPTPKQLIETYENHPGAVLGCIRTSNPNDGARYGFAVGDAIDKYVTKAKSLIEKPGVGKAPSELAQIGAMILPGEIFAYLEKADKEMEVNRELFYLDGLKLMMVDGYPVYALEYQNYKYYDTGDRFGYLKALVELGLESEEIGVKFREYLKGLKL